MELREVISSLLEDHAANAVRGALILHWARLNGISASVIRRGHATDAFISSGEPRERDSVERRLIGLVPRLSEKDVERAFEELIGDGKKRSHGVVYTPDYVIDYLVRNALHIRRQDRGMLPVLCDPSCGSGGFLVRAAEILIGDYNLTPQDVWSKCLVGIDIDPLALRQARCILELYAALRGMCLPDAVRLVNRNVLLSDPVELGVACDAHQGFDVIVTNPPYVKLQNLTLEYREKLARRYSDFVTGSFSLALLFLVAGSRMLSSGGILAVITQNNLFTSLAGRKVREYLQGERIIRRIVDFGHRKIFDNASAYTCLVFLGTGPSDSFEYETLSDCERIDLALSEKKTDYSLIKFGYLKPEKWRLAKGRHLENLWKIETSGRPLGEVLKISVGFATLKDSIFLVRFEEGRCVASLSDGQDIVIEEEITRPAVKVSELKNSKDLVHSNLRVVFPYEKMNGRYVAVPEGQLRKRYPGAFSYLSQQRGILQTRDKGRKKYATWYAWGRTQGMEAPGPKLLTKTFSKKPQFFYDPTDQLLCNGYGLFPKKPTLFHTEVPFEALRRILNSKLMHYYAKLTSFHLEGDYQCYQKNFIERFGIVNLDEDQIGTILQLDNEELEDYLLFLYGIRKEDVQEVVGGDYAR